MKRVESLKKETEINTHLINEKEEVSIGGIKMSFNPKSADLSKVMVVNMCINPKQPPNDGLNGGLEGLGEFLAW